MEIMEVLGDTDMISFTDCVGSSESGKREIVPVDSSSKEFYCKGKRAGAGR